MLTTLLLIALGLFGAALIFGALLLVVLITHSWTL